MLFTPLFAEIFQDMATSALGMQKDAVKILKEHL
jgi:hypothetical protein